MAEVYLGMGRTESLIMSCATIATHAPENSTAAMLENILTRFARIETRLIEHERRAAATLPPLRPDPDPPDGPPFYTATQPLYPPYQPPLLPYQPDRYLPLTPYTYATSLLHQTHQSPPPPTNSIGHQPYTMFDAAAQPQPYLHHPSHPPCSGPDPYVQQCLPDAGYPPWQLEYQPPRPLPLPNRSPTPMHSTSCWSPPSHRRSAAPLPAVTAAPPPPPLRSGSTHPPQSPKKFIDSGRQHGLTNNPNLLVRSLSPAQLAAVSDYNEKLRVYRLDQAALLARVTAWFEKNIDDENIAEENFEDAPAVADEEKIASRNQVEEKECEHQKILQEKRTALHPTAKYLGVARVVRGSTNSYDGYALRALSCGSTRISLFSDPSRDGTCLHKIWSMNDSNGVLGVSNGAAFVTYQRYFAFDPGGNLAKLYEGRNSPVMCPFDPGGYASQSFCYRRSSLLLDFHLEDKVIFNRGGVDTSISPRIFPTSYYEVSY